MTTETKEVYKSNWGYHPCSYEVYQKLKKLNHLCLIHKKARRKHERWENKMPHNRVEHRWIKNQQGQRIKRIVVGPVEEPKKTYGPILERIKKPDVWGSWHPCRAWGHPNLEEIILWEYETSKRPKAREDQVVKNYLTEEKIDQLIVELEKWIAS